MLSQLTEHQLQDYENDGFLCVRGLLSLDVVLALQREISTIATNQPPGIAMARECETRVNIASEGQMPIRKIRGISRLSQTTFSVCTTAPMVPIAKQILGGPIAFYGDQVLFKSAMLGSCKPLHQDAAYFKINPTTSVITIWCSLNAADESNGCMHYIPGSHRYGRLPHTQIQDTSHLFVGYSTSSLVAVPTAPGDCIIHNSLTLHMTPENKSTRNRLALLAHYVRLDATFPARSLNAPPVIPLN